MDTLGLLLENLRFISESNANAITARATNEWTIYISLLTFFIVISGAAIKLQFNLKKNERIIWISSISLIALVGILLFINIHIGHQKNHDIYLKANDQITTTLQNHNLLNPEDTKTLNKHYLHPKHPHAGAWFVCLLQIGIILIFALMAIIIILRKEQDKAKNEIELKNKEKKY
jgi:hypothetical protein